MAITSGFGTNQRKPNEMEAKTNKPKLYVVGGKWYCQRSYSDGPVSTRVALGVARDTPEDAYAAWVDAYRGCWQVLPAQRAEAGGGK